MRQVKRFSMSPIQLNLLNLSPLHIVQYVFIVYVTQLRVLLQPGCQRSEPVFGVSPVVRESDVLFGYRDYSPTALRSEGVLKVFEDF
jgi:hypothetical protein